MLIKRRKKAFLPLWVLNGSSLNKLESPHPRMLCAKFGWNWSSGLLRGSRKYEKFTNGRTDKQTDGQTMDQRQSEKLTWAFSTGDLKSWERKVFKGLTQTLDYHIKNLFLSYIKNKSFTEWCKILSFYWEGTTYWLLCSNDNSIGKIFGG